MDHLNTFGPEGGQIGGNSHAASPQGSRQRGKEKGMAERAHTRGLVLYFTQSKENPGLAL